MVKIKGIEPLAFAPQMRRSTKLSYILLYVTLSIMCLLSDFVRVLSEKSEVQAKPKPSFVVSFRGSS